MKNILKSLIILLILTTGETELRSINVAIEKACQVLNGTWTDDDNSCQNITEGQCANNLKGYWADEKCYSSPEEATKVFENGCEKHCGGTYKGGNCDGITQDKCTNNLHGVWEDQTSGCYINEHAKNCVKKGGYYDTGWKCVLSVE